MYVARLRDAVQVVNGRYDNVTRSNSPFNFPMQILTRGRGREEGGRKGRQGMQVEARF